MKVLIVDSDARRRAMIGANLRPDMDVTECINLTALRRALAGPAPAAVVIGALPGGGHSVMAAIHDAKAAHPETTILYLADALPGILPARAEGPEAHYLPPLMSGADIAAAVLQSLTQHQHQEETS